jgi:hypothetical protein
MAHLEHLTGWRRVSGCHAPRLRGHVRSRTEDMATHAPLEFSNGCRRVAMAPDASRFTNLKNALAPAVCSILKIQPCPSPLES